MTIRTFWMILLRILGLWLILASFGVLPQVFSFIGYLGYTDSDFVSTILMVSISLLVVAVYIGLMLISVYNPGYIIRKLNLDKGFDQETIDLNFNMNTILTIAVIVLGGIILIDTLPILCREIVMFMQQKAVISEYYNTGSLILYSVKTLIGYLLMTNSKSVVAFINRKKEEVTGLS